MSSEPAFPVLHTSTMRARRLVADEVSDSAFHGLLRDDRVASTKAS